MRVFIVLAHPEQQSLTHSIHRSVVDELIKNGHGVEISDLYAMKFDPVLSRKDAPLLKDDERFEIGKSSYQAFQGNLLPQDVLAEQEKIKWADLVIIHFPVWWFQMPAILKGWFDRVFTAGFAYLVFGEKDGKQVNLRYGDGIAQSKRAMIITTTGAGPEPYSERGINGPIDGLLWPINHGLLHFVGFSVHRPQIIHSTVSPDFSFEKADREIRARIRNIDCEQPIKYRTELGGDYDSNSVLKPELKPNQSGIEIHVTN